MSFLKNDKPEIPHVNHGLTLYYMIVLNSYGCVSFETDVMNKQFGAIFLLAGTAIGSGMISLPIVLAKFGVPVSILLMVAFAVIAYFSSIMRCDLNLNSKANFSLKEVGELYGGKFAGFVGSWSIKILMFALISAYLFGLSSIVNELCKGCVPQNAVIIGMAVMTLVVLAFASETVIRINKSLFIFMIAAFIILVVMLLYGLEGSDVPTIAMEIDSIKSWACIVPVIFTSFGFQGSLHNMTEYVDNDIKLIKRSSLFGSLIPAIVYIIWTSSILVIVFNSDHVFFEKMMAGNVSAGELVMVLSKVCGAGAIPIAVRFVSIFAILTSLVGVGLSLFSAYSLELKVKNPSSKRMICAILTVIPSMLVAMVVPDAFIKTLNFAGIILAVLAIVLPAILHENLQNQQIEDKKLMMKNKLLVRIIFAIGVIIVALGICW
ncbi:MAG: hypothetical protein LBT03_03645 [Holosporales bacterium]|nr:hypothetical protein [Holosporales bacterium]